MVPGPGTATRLGVTTALRSFGLTRGIAAGLTRASAASGGRALLTVPSLPFRAADAVLNRTVLRGFEAGVAGRLAGEAAGEGAKRAAAGAVGRFLTASPRREFIARESARIGLASAFAELPPWQGGVSGALEAGAMGAAEGLGFGVINSKMAGILGTALRSSEPGTRAAAGYLLRGTLNAAYAGGLATVQGAETPMVLYHAALGGLLGAVELPFEEVQARRFLSGLDPHTRANPDTAPGFAALDPEVQREVRWEAEVERERMTRSALALADAAAKNELGPDADLAQVAQAVAFKRLYEEGQREGYQIAASENLTGLEADLRAAEVAEEKALAGQALAFQRHVRGSLSSEAVAALDAVGTQGEPTRLALDLNPDAEGDVVEAFGDDNAVRIRWGRLRRTYEESGGEDALGPWGDWASDRITDALPDTPTRPQDVRGPEDVPEDLGDASGDPAASEAPLSAPPVEARASTVRPGAVDVARVSTDDYQIPDQWRSPAELFAERHAALVRKAIGVKPVDYEAEVTATEFARAQALAAFEAGAGVLREGMVAAGDDVAARAAASAAAWNRVRIDLAEASGVPYAARWGDLPSDARDALGDLRRSWIHFVGDAPILQGYLDATDNTFRLYGGDGLGARSGDGKDIRRSRAETVGEQVLRARNPGRRIVLVQNAEAGGLTARLGESQDPLDWARLVTSAHRQGWTFVGGNKDKGEFYFAERPEAGSPADAYDTAGTLRAMDEAWAGLDARQQARMGDLAPSEAHRRLREKGIAELVEAGVAADEAARIYDAEWAEGARLIEDLGGAPLAQLARDAFGHRAPVREPGRPLSPDEQVLTALYADYISKATYRDAEGREIPEKAPEGIVYHGTHQDNVRINERGELILLPSDNFGDRQHGVSFTEWRDAAKFYAEHDGGNRRGRSAGRAVVAVDTRRLPELSRESDEELFADVREPIVVPEGAYAVYAPRGHAEAVREFYEREAADLREQYGDDPWAMQAEDAAIAERDEISEFNRDFESDPRSANEESDAILDFFGRFSDRSARSRYVAERLGQRLEELGPLGFLEEARRKDQEWAESFGKSSLDELDAEDFPWFNRVHGPASYEKIAKEAIRSAEEARRAGRQRRGFPVETGHPFPEHAAFGPLLPQRDGADAPGLGGSAHLLDAINFNKRAQVLWDGAPRADLAFQPARVRDPKNRYKLPDRPGHVGYAREGHLRTVVVDAKTISGIPAIVDAQGRAQDHHLDGVLFVRQDVFDGLVADVGGDPDAGFVKLTEAFTDQHGLFVGKLGAFRAPDAIEREMARLGADQLMFDSAAKVTGRRPTAQLLVSQNEAGDLRLAVGDPQGQRKAHELAFDVPVTSLRLNTGTLEQTAKALKDQRAPRQWPTNFRSPEAQEAVWNAVVLPSVRGTVEAENALLDAVNRADATRLDAVDVDDIPLARLTEVLFQPEHAYMTTMGGIYGRLLSKIVTKAKDDPALLDEMLTTEDGVAEGNVDADAAQRAADALREYTSVADRILKSAGQDLSPAVAHMEPVAPYVQQVLRAYLRGRVLRPKVPNSGKGILYPNDPAMRLSLQKEGDALHDEVTPGFVYFGEAVRNKKVRWVDGASVRLGDAFDQYRAERSPERKAQMERLLSFHVVRVPADSTSGTRALRFGGFTGRKGAGIVVHNEEMIALGGADLDADSAFYFQDPDTLVDPTGASRPMEAELLAARDQWLTDEGKRQAPRPDRVRPLQDSKSEEDAFVRPLDPEQQSPVAMGDARTLFQVGRGAYQGNRTLGGAATAGRRGQAWLEALERARATKDGELLRSVTHGSAFIRDEGPEGTGEGGWINFRLRPPTDDGGAFFAWRRQAMNFAADAGNFAGLRFDNFSIGRFLGTKLRDGGPDGYDVLMDDGGRKRWVSRADLTDEQRALYDDHVGAAGTDLWKRLAEADRLGDGKNRKEDRPYTLDETLNGLRAAEGLGDLGTVHYRALEALGRLPHRDRSFGDTGTMSHWAPKGFARLTRAVTHLYRSQEPAARLLADLLGDQGRKAVSVAHDPAQGERGFKPWKADQDAADVVSTVLMARFGQRALAAGVTPERMRQIVSHAQALREDAAAWGRGLGKRKRGEHDAVTEEEASAMTPEAAEQAAADAKRSLNLSPEEADLFDGWLLSSLNRRDASYDAFVAERVGEATREIDAQIQGMRLPGPNPIPEAQIRKAEQERAEIITEAEKRAEKDWRATNRQSFGFGSKTVAPHVLRQWTRLYDEAVGMAERFQRDGNEGGPTRADVEAEAARWLYGRDDAEAERGRKAFTDLYGNPEADEFVPGTSLLNEAPQLDRWTDGLLDELWGLAERGEGMLAVKPNESPAERRQRMRLERLSEDFKAVVQDRPWVRRHFAGVFAGVVSEARMSSGGIGETPAEASVAALEDFVEFFRDARTGELGPRTLDPDDKGPRVPKLAYWLFPDYTERFMGRYEEVPEPVVRYARTRGEDDTAKTAFVRAMIPSSTMGLVKRFAHDITQQEEAHRARERAVQDQHLAFLRTVEGLGGPGVDPERVYGVAVALHEREGARRGYRAAEAKGDEGRMRHYGIQVRATEAEWKGDAARGLFGYEGYYNQMKGRRFRINTPEGPVELSGAELVERTRALVESEVRRARTERVVNAEEANRWIVDRDGTPLRPFEATDDAPGGLRVRYDTVAALDVERTLKGIHAHMRATGEVPQMGVDALDLLTHRLALEGVTRQFRVRDPEGRTGIRPDERGEVRGEMSPAALRDNGLDAEADRIVRALARSKGFRYRGTGYVEGYFPRLGWTEARVRQHLLEKMGRADAEDLSKADRLKLQMRVQQMYASGVLGREDVPADLLNDVLVADHQKAADRLLRRTERAGMDARPGNLRERSDDPIPGWDKSPKAFAAYADANIRAYHRKLFGLLANRTITAFEKDGRMGDTTTSWARFMRLYARDVVGYPSVFPDSWLEDEALQLKSSGYYPFTDHAVEAKLRGIDRRFFGSKYFPTVDGQPSRPGDLHSEAVSRRLGQLSRLEAKWNFISLLARPKAAVNNLSQLGITYVSAGWAPWKQALDPRWVRDHLSHPDIRDAEGNPILFERFGDVLKFAEKHGVVESFIADELDLGRFAGTKEGDAFMADLRAATRRAWRRGGDVTDLTVRELADKHGLGRSLFQKGAWFMRTSERALRAHAFLAHYIHARRVLDGSRAEYGPEDPWLIHMAKRGVEATQFLYNNASRPAVARTPIGKIAFRFQSWAWNSVRFQRTVAQDAARMGFRKGTPEMARFERMATMNLLAFGLASIFPASFFESTLPQPLGWAKDLSDYLFAEDEEERSRAFLNKIPFADKLGPARYLVEPLAMFAPPSFRVLETVGFGEDGFTAMDPMAYAFGALTGIDLVADPLASYESWSLYPFGLLARDAAYVARSPISLVDRVSGIPLFQMQRKAQAMARANEPEEEGGEPSGLLPPLDFGIPGR